MISILIEGVEVSSCGMCPQYSSKRSICKESGFVVNDTKKIDPDCLYLTNAADEEVFEDDLLDLEDDSMESNDESDEGLYFDPAE